MDSNEIALRAFLSHQSNTANIGSNAGGSYISWIKSQYPTQIVDAENKISQWKNDYEASNVINQAQPDSVVVELALENDNGVADIDIDIRLHMKELSFNDTPNKHVKVDNFYVDGEKVEEESEMFVYIPSGLNMLSQFEQDEGTLLVTADEHEEAVCGMYDDTALVDLEEEDNEHFSKEDVDDATQLDIDNRAKVEDLVFSDDSDTEDTSTDSDHHHNDREVSEGKAMSETEVCMALDALRQSNARYASISNAELLTEIGNISDNHACSSIDNGRVVGERWYEDVEDFQPIDEE